MKKGIIVIATLMMIHGSHGMDGDSESESFGQTDSEESELEYAINWRFPLVDAVLYSNYPLTRSAMEVEQEPKELNTALLFAVQMQDEKIVELLLKKKINPNILVDHEEATPLMRAVVRDNEAIIKLLFQYGAHPDTRNPLAEGCLTALHLAARQSHITTPRTVRLLLRKGADPLAQAPECGSTPLMMAVRPEIIHNIQALLTTLSESEEVRIRKEVYETRLCLHRMKLLKDIQKCIFNKIVLAHVADRMDFAQQMVCMEDKKKRTVCQITKRLAATKDLIDDEVCQLLDLKSERSRKFIYNSIVAQVKRIVFEAARGILAASPE